MKTVSLSSLIGVVRLCIEGKTDYRAVREYVFSRYEAEVELAVTPEADELLSVLAPYVESEEAFGDAARNTRLRRLVRLLERQPHHQLSALAVFALKYDEIQQLVGKHESGLISDAVLREQVSKLSPAKFDIDSVISWARSHRGKQEPDASTLT